MNETIQQEMTIGIENSGAEMTEYSSFTHNDKTVSASEIEPKDYEKPDDNTAVVDIPHVDPKDIARQNTLKRLHPLYDNIIAERQQILLKQIPNDGELSESEKAKIKYLEWQLDMIEDALHGEQLDLLEGFIERTEVLAQQITTDKNFLVQILSPNEKRRHGKGKRRRK